MSLIICQIFYRKAVQNKTSCFFSDKYEIYVELVSRVKPDTLYRLNALSYSSITIRGQQYKFSQAGHHFIVLNPKTGKYMLNKYIVKN